MSSPPSPAAHSTFAPVEARSPPRVLSAGLVTVVTELVRVVTTVVEPSGRVVVNVVLTGVVTVVTVLPEGVVVRAVVPGDVGVVGVAGVDDPGVGVGVGDGDGDRPGSVSHLVTMTLS